MIRFSFSVPKLTTRDYKVFAVLLALDAVMAFVLTMWALTNLLTGAAPASWWVVAFGAVVVSGASAGALWCRRRAARTQAGGAA